MMTQQAYEAFEDNLWQHVAHAAEKLAQNPKDREGAKLLTQARQVLAGLREEKSQQIANADERLSQNPRDEEAHKLLTHGRDCLEDLQIAEAILSGLSG